MRESEERKGEKAEKIYAHLRENSAVSGGCAREKRTMRWQKRERSCKERGAILIASFFLAARWPPLFEKQKRDSNFLSSPSGERRFRDQSMNTSQA